ncbi:MAG: sigma-70 family RNA polymerase sigma factor [Turicibacter sp.]
MRSDVTGQWKLECLAISGDAQAYTELLQLYKVYLYKMAFSYVKDEQKALDLVQECTYKGFVSIHKLKNPQYFKTWITKILINEALFMVRKDSKVVYLDEGFPLADSKSSLSIETKLDLYDAMDQIRPEYKTVIILKYFNDLGVEQISQMMDLPVNTVKSHLNRAKAELKILLKEENFHE